MSLATHKSALKRYVKGLFDFFCGGDITVGLHMCEHLQAPARVVAEDDMLWAIVDVGPRLARASRELWQRLVPVCACRALCSHMPHLQIATACTYSCELFTEVHGP